MSEKRGDWERRLISEFTVLSGSYLRWGRTGDDHLPPSCGSLGALELGAFPCTHCVFSANHQKGYRYASLQWVILVSLFLSFQLFKFFSPSSVGTWSGCSGELNAAGWIFLPCTLCGCTSVCQPWSAVLEWLSVCARCPRCGSPGLAGQQPWALLSSSSAPELWFFPGKQAALLCTISCWGRERAVGCWYVL